MSNSVKTSDSDTTQNPGLQIFSQNNYLACPTLSYLLLSYSQKKFHVMGKREGHCRKY